MKTTSKRTTLPKMPQLPAGSMKGSNKGKIRKPGDSDQGGDGQMADYARMIAAGGA